MSVALTSALPLPVSALYLAGRHRLPKVRVFLDFLVERFGSAPWRIETKKLTALGKMKGL
jgi:DNA-binding transcriptional LysR family regulator